MEILKYELQTGKEKHQITNEGNNWICDCKSFKYRHQCNHISEIKKRILFRKERQDLMDLLNKEVREFENKYNVRLKLKKGFGKDLIIYFV